MPSIPIAHPQYGRRLLWRLSAASLVVSGAAGLGLSRPAIAMPMRIRLGGTGVALGAFDRLRPLLRAELGVYLDIIRGLGTLGGISAASAGRLDIAVSARAATAAEREGRITDRLWATTPLVLATRADGGVERLTSQQAVGMIGGEITHWEDGHRVRVTRRPSQDGDTALLAGLSEPMARAVAAMQARPGVLTAVTDHDQATALERSIGSFGAIGLGLIYSEDRAIRPLKLDGMAPTDPRWPMQKSLFLVHPRQPEAAVSQMLQLLFSEPAAALLLPLGYRVRGEA